MHTSRQMAQAISVLAQLNELPHVRRVKTQEGAGLSLCKLGALRKATALLPDPPTDRFWICLGISASNVSGPQRTLH